MQRILTGLMGLVLAGGTLATEVYKCVDPLTGRLTISQTQCAPEAKPVTVTVTRPSAEAIQTSRQLWDEIVVQQDVARRQRDLAQEALRHQEWLQAEQRALKQQQEALRDASRPEWPPRKFVYPEARWKPHQHPRLDRHDDRNRPPPWQSESEKGGRWINGTAWPGLSIKPATGRR